MSTTDTFDGLLQSTFEIGRVMRQRMMGAAHDKANFLQLHALTFVTEHPGLTMKELAEALHVSSPSATALADRLVKLKWIARTRDSKNRKLVRLKVLPGGKAVIERKQKHHRVVITELFGVLTPSEQTTLTKLHRKVLEQYQSSL
jgi:DNA-binding MarR family transcriptional regulator